MFKSYKFKKEDFTAIEESIAMVYGKKMEHVFLHGLGDVDLTSYDSKFIYLWSRRNYPKIKKIKDSVCKFTVYRFPHKLILTDDDYLKMSWADGGIKIGGRIFRDLPSSYNIHCAPTTARVKLFLKQHEVPASGAAAENAHYRAVIAHEFAHYYFDLNINHPFSKQLLKVSKSSAKLTETKLAKLLKPPAIDSLAELFASLIELETLKIFYPEFLKKEIKGMNLYVKRSLSKTACEKEITPINSSHVYAKIMAPRVLKSFPNWPGLLHKHLF